MTTGVLTVWSYDLLSLNNLAYTTASDATSGSANLTGVAVAGSIGVGWGVSGPGIPSGTTVASISGSTVTMTQTATSSPSSGSITFSNVTAHGEVLLNDIAFSQRLNSAGQLTGKITLSDPRVAADKMITATTPGKTLLCIDLDGLLIWAGLVRSRNFSTTEQALSITVSEAYDYFASRHQEQDYSLGYATTSPGSSYWSTSPADPRVIAAAVLADGLDAGGTAYSAFQLMGIQWRSYSQLVINSYTGCDQPGSPPLYAPSWPVVDRMTIDHIITNLSGAGFKAGYDFLMQATWLNGTGSVPIFTFSIDFPRVGTQTSQEITNLTLTSSSTTATYTGFDPVVGTYVGVVGGGSGGTGTVPSGTTITAVSNWSSPKTVTLSSAATGSGTATAQYDPLRMVADWWLDLSEAVSYEWDEDATQMAQTVVASSSSTLVGPVINTDYASLNSGWPLYEEITAFVNAADLTTLQNDVNGEIGRRAWPSLSVTVTVPWNYAGCPIGPHGASTTPSSSNGSNMINSVTHASSVDTSRNYVVIGDNVQVYSPADDRFPSGLSTIMRIVGIDVMWPDGGMPTVQFTLNTPLYGLPGPQPPGLV